MKTDGLLGASAPFLPDLIPASFRLPSGDPDSPTVIFLCTLRRPGGSFVPKGGVRSPQDQV